MLRTVSAQSILHVSSRELVQKLRDDILRIHGFDVDSTLYRKDSDTGLLPDRPHHFPELRKTLDSRLMNALA